MAQEPEALIVRSRVAALHAKQLKEALIASRAQARELIAVMRSQCFVPVERKIFYPQDFPKEKRNYLFHPASNDEA